MGPSYEDWLFFACLYPVAGIGVTVSLHRYFSHRSFDTSRVFQFVLALMAATGFGDAIRFAGKHRLHHLHADTDQDVHAPCQGLWHCWIGSLIFPDYPREKIEKQAADLMRYPELRWLSRYYLVPGLTLGAVAYWLGGITMLGVGVCLVPVVLIHQSAAVNYFCHRFGYSRYDNGDQSRNNVLVALFTLGEGWHNNHHHRPSSARTGETWWEVDVLYWFILLLESLGLVWNVRVHQKS